MRAADFASGEQLAQIKALKKRRRRNRVYIPLGIILGAIAVFIALSATKPQAERKAAEVRAPLVSTITVAPRDWRFVVETQGTVTPRTETNLVSEVSGKIAEVSEDFVAGGFFEKGQVLVQIDDSDYQTALEQARATLASRRAQLAQEQARAEQAVKDWEKLGRSDEPSDLVLRRPQLAEARAAVQAAEAEQARAQRNLERSQIRAPYDGMVRSKRADVGQYVAPGTALADIFAVDYAEVRLPVSDDDLAFLQLPKPGSDEAGPQVDLAYRNEGRSVERRARIQRREAWLDENTRMQYLVARIEDPYSLDSEAPVLPVGRFVTAAIAGVNRQDVFVLPRHLLQRGDRVMTVDEDGRLDIREVEVLRSDDEHAFVTGGLESGAKVITSALEVPVEGMEVRVAGETGESPAKEDVEDSNATAQTGA